MTLYVLIEKAGVLSVKQVTSEKAEAMRQPCKTCGGERYIITAIDGDGGPAIPDYQDCPDCITVHSARETQTEADIDKMELERRRRNEQSI